MAAYSDLAQLINDPTLRDRVAVALLVAADVIRLEGDAVPNHSNRLKWAKQVLRSPYDHADDMVRALIGQNKDLTVTQIQGVIDTQIQNAVNSSIDIFADGEF